MIIALPVLEAAAKAKMSYAEMRSYLGLPHDKNMQKIYKVLLAGGDVIILDKKAA